ncbi:uncharacterized protein LOC128036131 [Gossypium raimondii]|uniref:uncharacterized protein LOC128036131 n=1 Tax=Gossypium raimondii TaxID=29730 RepID=UPI00227C8D84|nr:uncharacterized protein LOC128036131 [Gossypium raimondii]
MDIVKFDGPSSAENLLPNHAGKGVNAIAKSAGRRIKENIAEVKTPLREVWKEMVENGLIVSDLEDRSQGVIDYCAFHDEKGHEIQECSEFRALVQGLMDNKKLEFFEYVEGNDVCASEGGSSEKVYRANHPIIIISRLRANEIEAQVTLKVIIQKLVAFLYKDSKMVPWNYDCNVTFLKEEGQVCTLEEDKDMGSYTRSGKRYDAPNTKIEPVKEKSLVVEQRKEKPELPANELITERKAKKFLKFIKHSEYSIVEQLHKQLARISVLALLLSSETHHNALMKVLNETYATDDILVNKLDHLVNNIKADNFIFFNDGEIPPGGMGSTKALHITTRCKGHTLPGILIDNGSALNVLPLSTLNRLPVDNSHMKSCQNIVRAFDGIEKNVMGRIEIPLLIGPNTYKVDFLIHSTRAVPSSLHQKLKLVTEGRLVTINAEEDIIASITNDAPYIKADGEAIECSFQLLEFVNATFIVEGSKIPVPKISKAMRISLRLTAGKGALPGRGLGKYLQGQLSLNSFVLWISLRAYSRSPYINDMSDSDTDSESPFKQDMCLEGSQDFENDKDCSLSPDLLRMVEQEEK